MSAIKVNPRFSISSASSDGTNATYICNNNFSAGQRIVVSGSSNSEFDTEDSPLLSATSTQFVIANKNISASATSTGGLAYLVNAPWKRPGTVYVKVNGVWRIVLESYAKVNGIWRETTFGTPPDMPSIDWYSTGKFIIKNYDSSLTYDTEYVSGSGSVSLDKNTGIFTLSGENSAFYVVSRYAPGSPPSAKAYMERKKKTRTYVPQCKYIPRTCQRDTSYAAHWRDVPQTITGDTSNCAMYSCPAPFRLVGPDGSNRCECDYFGSRFVVGGGQCPGGWSVCQGNKCCTTVLRREYFCPSGGSLSGTTCVRSEPFDCSYWEPCYTDDPKPQEYNESGGEWWRTSI